MKSNLIGNRYKLLFSAAAKKGEYGLVWWASRFDRVQGTINLFRVSVNAPASAGTGAMRPFFVRNENLESSLI
ncbi:MAG TPA: hypothetical protein DC047_20360 [Blastocatellia bacterium]|nr:hypothetical protein [Blastocatellia bacterium]